MRKLLLVLFIFSSLAATAQNPFSTTDTLRNYINRYIRNSAVEAFQNLRLNRALNGLTYFADSAYGGQVKSYAKVNDSTLRLITIANDTFDVNVSTSGSNLYLRNTGTTGSSIGVSINDSTFGFKKLIAGTNVTFTDADSSITIAASGGSGSPGGSTTQVQYNNAGSFGGDAGMTYDASINEITTDSINLKNINVTASGSGDIVIVRSANSVGVYGGIDFKNTIRASWPQFKLSNDLGYSMRHYIVNVDSSATSVIKSNSPGGLVLMTGHDGGVGSAQNIWFETHGVNGADFAGTIFGDTKNWNIGGNFTDQGRQLYVDGAARIKTTLEISDEGHFYSWVKPYNYNNSSTYVEGVGIKFYGITSAGGTSPTFAIDSIGNIEVPAYPSTRNDGYTPMALYTTGTGANGRIKYGHVFDNNSGTRNDGQIVYWNTSVGVPSSSNGLTYLSSNLGVTGSGTFTGKIKLRDTLVIADKGFTHAYIKAGNYQDNANYVEGVNITVLTRNVSGLVTAAVFDSSGNIRIPSGGLAVGTSTFSGSEKLNVVGDVRFSGTPTALAGDTKIIVKGASDSLLKQSSLKTVNGNSLFGSGDVTVSASNSLVVVNDADYTIAAGVTHVVYSNLTTGRTITMPAASSNTNRMLTIKHGGGGAFSITLSVAYRENSTTTGSTIPQNGWITVVSDGTDWYLVATK